MFHRLKRQTKRKVNQWFYRIDRRSLDECLRRCGMPKGAVVCVHSAVNRMGYLDGGIPMVLQALMDAVGPEGTLLMPTFPATSSMLRYLEQGDVFDVQNTPSRVGIITETFRRMPGVRRSRHPTNPMAAWGACSDELLRDHEKSPTPYGYDTPYGRLAERDDSFILMFGTPILSLLHHLQERVDFPCLFLEEPRQAHFIDENGQAGTLTTRVMRPRTPYYVAVPAATGSAPDWAVLHDYALVFPRRRKRVLARRGYKFAGFAKILNRADEFEREGILRSARLGRSELGLLHVRGFIERIEPELRGLIDRYRQHYDSEKIAALGLPYF